MSDIELVRKPEGFNLYGYKILSGHEDKVKKIVLDALNAETDWKTAVRKMDDGVGKVIGKKLNTYTFDDSKIYNRSTTYGDQTIMLNVKGSLKISFAPISFT